MSHIDQIIRESAVKGRRQLLMEELKRQMSGISERAFCAGWDYRVADELPPVLVVTATSGVPGNYHGAIVWPIHAAWLVSLATELGHWVNLDEGKTVAYHPPSLLTAPAAAVGPDGQ